MACRKLSDANSAQPELTVSPAGRSAMFKIRYVKEISLC